jgi:HEAT repeat protein
MFRSPRTIASLIYSLLIGTTATVGLATVATTLVGCKDESQPDYWIDKLEEPSWRPRAVKRLEQFYEDAVTKANKNLDDPQVKALLDKTAVPLTNTYVNYYGDLDLRTRVSLIKLLSAFRDPRTEPAIKKAFEEFAKHPKSSQDEQDIKWAARAAKELKLASVGGPMLDTFEKMKTHTMLGGIVYRDLNEAMLAMPQASWAPRLQAMLQQRIKTPNSAKDANAVDEFRDQLFWQTTSAQLLGEIGDASAVEPLIKVMLDPAKVDVQTTALLALVKIGKPAVDAGVKLLKGEKGDWEAFNLRATKEATGEKEADKTEPYKRIAAIILGTIGRSEATLPMVEALKSEKQDVNKAVLARELTKLPPSAPAKQAFKEAFQSISPDTIVPPGMNALQMLAEAAARFYDPGMIDWLLEQAADAKGSAEDKKALQSVITVSVLKLGKVDQLPEIRKAVSAYGTQIEKDALALAEKQLKACGDRVSCYLAEVEKSENQDPKTQFAGIKAAYMIGVLGNEQSRDELIKRLDAVENAAVRFTAAQSIDYLSPKGSKEAATRLEEIIDKNVKTADRGKIMGDQPLKEVMYRLRGRAG